MHENFRFCYFILMFSFEKLEVWQLARNLTSDIYKLTDKFPSTEKFVLTSQMRRASISVMSNIAEGISRSTPRDQARFTTIAYSSLMELFNQLVTSTDVGFMNANDLGAFRIRVRNLSVKLSNFRASQLRNR